MDLTERFDHPEIMDTQALPVDVMRGALRFLAVTNRFFGGTEVVLRRFREWSRAWDPSKTVRVLDVGAGGAEIPVAIARWARAQGFKVHVTAIDLIEEAAQVARENARGVNDVSIQRRDLFDINPAQERFDYVIASLLLHHIPPAQSVRLLKTFDALATRGVLISDLYRSSMSYAAVTAISYLIGNAVVRHDGPLSVRRAFRVEELSSLAEEAGLPYLMARLEPWFRVSLSGEKP